MAISLLIDIGIELLKLVIGVKVCMFGQLVIVLEVHKFTAIVIAKQKHYFEVAATDSIIKLQQVPNTNIQQFREQELKQVIAVHITINISIIVKEFVIIVKFVKQLEQPQVNYFN